MHPELPDSVPFPGAQHSVPDPEVPCRSAVCVCEYKCLPRCYPHSSEIQGVVTTLLINKLMDRCEKMNWRCPAAAAFGPYEGERQTC